MIGLRRALVAIGIAGVAGGAAALAIILTSRHVSHPVATAALGLTIAWSCIGTGLFAWWRRPQNRFGSLMTALGFAFLLNSLTAANAPGLFTAGLLLGDLFLGVFVHMLLAFPTGRLETTGQRRLVVGVYLLVTVMEIPAALFSDHCGCGSPRPENVLLVAHRPGLADASLVLNNLIGATFAVILVVMLTRKWRAASARQRRALAPVLWMGAAIGVAVGVNLVIGATVGEGPLRSAVVWIGLSLLVLLPFAFLFGLMRAYYSRGDALTELVGRIGERGEPTALRDALQEALGDPSLDLAYWLPEPSATSTRAAHRSSSPPARRAPPWSRSSATASGSAAIVHDAALGDEPELIATVAAAAGLASSNERLQAELRAQRRGAAALAHPRSWSGLAERRRLERDLHDGAQQRLVSAGARPAARGARRWTATRTRRDAARRRAEPSWTRRSPSCASWPAASIPRSSTDRGLGAGARGARPRARRCRSRSTRCPTSACRAGRGGGVLRRRRGAGERRPSTRARRAHVGVDARERHAVGRGRATTAWAARTPDGARACAASSTGSRALDGRLEVDIAARGGARRSARRSRARSLIAEDSVLLREGLARLLADAGFEVVGAGRRRRGPAAQGRRAHARRGDRRHPDAADATPTRACAPRSRSAPSRPDIGVLVLSQYVEERVRARAARRRAPAGVGYLLKDRVADVDEFVDAVRRVGRGRLGARPRGRLPAASAARAGRSARRAHPARARGARADGRGPLEPRRSRSALVVTERAVEKHVTSIFAKLGLAAAPEDHRRVLAVLPSFSRSERRRR